MYILLADHVPEKNEKTWNVASGRLKICENNFPDNDKPKIKLWTNRTA
jgi:hypothetical protein